MAILSSDRLLLLPLTRLVMATRLHREDFTLGCETPDGFREVHFGAEWPGDAYAMFARMLSDLGEAPYVEGTFVVVERATHEVVGQVGTMRAADDQGIVEIGYGINESRRGQGFATEAVGVLTAHLLGTAGIVRVIAATATGNVDSQRVLEVNGFGRTGTSVNDEDGDVILWARER